MCLASNWRGSCCYFSQRAIAMPHFQFMRLLAMSICVCDAFLMLLTFVTCLCVCVCVLFVLILVQLPILGHCCFDGWLNTMHRCSWCCFMVCCVALLVFLQLLVCFVVYAVLCYHVSPCCVLFFRLRLCLCQLRLALGCCFGCACRVRSACRAFVLFVVGS